MANSLSFPKEILNMSINTNSSFGFPLSPSSSIFDMMEPPPPPDHNTLSFKELLCTKDFNSNESLFDLFPTITTEDATNTNISFKELLCTKDFNSNQSIFDLFPTITTEDATNTNTNTNTITNIVAPPASTKINQPLPSPPASSNVVDCSEVLNSTPATPNFFSITSSPNEAAVGGNKSPEAENDGEKNADAEKGDENQVQDEITNKHVKENMKTSPTKKGRFAFKTKSEVDHLDDGYGWRKYVQKAVKNSPYPRSYYRCTADGCGVKKRVERSYEDPSTVVTTYDGNHTHPCPVLSNHRSSLGYRAYGSGRGNATAANSVGFSSSTRLVLKQHRHQFQNLQNNVVQYRANAASFSSSNSFLQNHNQGGSFVSSTWMSDAPRQGLLPAGNGLLQDIIMSAQMQRGQGIN